MLLCLVGVVGLNMVRGSRSGGEAPKLSEALRASLEQGGCTVDSRADNGQAHVTAPTYSVNPPAGGDHLSGPAPAGFYEMANVPADGRLVHSLEHGCVPDGAGGPIGTFVTAFRDQGPEKGFV